MVLELVSFALKPATQRFLRVIKVQLFVYIFSCSKRKRVYIGHCRTFFVLFCRILRWNRIKLNIARIKFQRDTDFTVLTTNNLKFPIKPLKFFALIAYCNMTSSACEIQLKVLANLIFIVYCVTTAFNRNNWISLKTPLVRLFDQKDWCFGIQQKRLIYLYYLLHTKYIRSFLLLSFL